MAQQKVAAWVVGLLMTGGAITLGGNSQTKTKTKTKMRPTTAAHSTSKAKLRGAAAAWARVRGRRPKAVTAPTYGVHTASQMTRYLKSQGLRTVMAAGIVGNLRQESTLNPTAPGYGLAQWNTSRWASASAWIRAHGQNPNSAGGQLMYIAANVQNNVDTGTFYGGLRSDLQRAHSPQQAALVWMNDYEQCNGAGHPGTTHYTQNSLCMPGQRMTYAGRAQ